MAKQKFYFLLLTLWICTIQSISALAAPQTIPDFSLEDRAGVPTTAAALRKEHTWMMLVVRPDARIGGELLAKLERSGMDWGGAVVILVVGNQKAFNSLVSQCEKLKGVTWYRGDEATATQALALTGYPTLLAVAPGNVVAWRKAGLPTAIQDTQRLILAWLTSR